MFVVRSSTAEEASGTDDDDDDDADPDDPLSRSFSSFCESQLGGATGASTYGCLSLFLSRIRHALMHIAPHCGGLTNTTSTPFRTCPSCQIGATDSI